MITRKRRRHRKCNYEDAPPGMNSEHGLLWDAIWHVIDRQDKMLYLLLGVEASIIGTLVAVLVF